MVAIYLTSGIGSNYLHVCPEVKKGIEFVLNGQKVILLSKYSCDNSKPRIGNNEFGFITCNAVYYINANHDHGAIVYRM